MRRSNTLLVIVALLLAGAFLYGVIDLFELRFASGANYPPYSTLRSDPLGTKAFFEGVGKVPGMTVMRNLDALNRVHGMRGTTLFLLGLDPGAFERLDLPTARALEDFALRGGRIVITFKPVHAQVKAGAGEQTPLANDTPPDNASDRNQAEEETTPALYVALTERWCLGLDERGLWDGKPERARRAADFDARLPVALSCHTALHFVLQDEGWETIYDRDDLPVLIERSYGKGRIVLSADSFFISNEAMKTERHPDLLAWLIGPSHTVLFDETHLGIARTPGIAALIRTHGLAPFFGALALLALLYIWRNAAAFLPPPAATTREDIDWGKDFSSGLTNLLRRNIPAEQVLETCLEEWQRDFTHGPHNQSALLPRMREILAAARLRKERDPIQAYRDISAITVKRPVYLQRRNHG